jgi:methionyl-tRNA formyltransferase
LTLAYILLFTKIPVQAMKITLFAKREKNTVNEVIEFLQTHVEDLNVYRGVVGDPFPEKAYEESPDILISYISPWIIPKKVLERTQLCNINFHPGPPEYPGIGCFNFALYNREQEYGVTAHIMDKTVDTGQIVGVKRFPLLRSETVYSLSIKSYGYMLVLFFEVMSAIMLHGKIPECHERWNRKPYKRRELEELCAIRVDMPENEIQRRIQATTYPGMPGAYLDLYGYKFEYNPER